MALSRQATELSEGDERVVDSMIESYERARADQQRFIERRGDADRRPASRPSRHRRVRVATTAERRDQQPD